MEKGGTRVTQGSQLHPGSWLERCRFVLPAEEGVGRFLSKWKVGQTIFSQDLSLQAGRGRTEEGR